MRNRATTRPERDPSAYIAPLRFPALSGWYDRVVAATTREAVWRERLVRLLVLEAGERVLDIGCGTGSLSLRMCAVAPSAVVMGIDADERALAIARDKFRSATPGIRLHRGLAQQLPFASEKFDVVVSSLFFHHLRSGDKREALREARRVLKPAGRLVIADWGMPTGLFSRAAFLAVQLLDGFETTQDSVTGALPHMMDEAGFDAIREAEPLHTPLGVMRFWRANVANRFEIHRGTPGARCFHVSIQ